MNDPPADAPGLGTPSSEGLPQGVLPQEALLERPFPENKLSNWPATNDIFLAC